MMKTSASRLTVTLFVFLTLAFLIAPVAKAQLDTSKEWMFNTASGNQKADGGSNHSDPINLATGDFYDTKTDLHIPGRGLDFNLTRTYHSKTGLWALHGPTVYINFQSPLGMNTDHSYNMRIEHHQNRHFAGSHPLGNTLALYDGTGRADLFHLQTTGSLDYRLPSRGELIPEGGVRSLKNKQIFGVVEFQGARYEVLYIDSENTVYTFHALKDDFGNKYPESGRLKSITDRNGNQIQVFYSHLVPTGEEGDWELFESGRPESRISHIIDTLGNQIDFYYHDQAPASPPGPYPPANDPDYRHLLWKIVDHAGREVHYQYEFRPGTSSEMVARRLTKVVLPAVQSDADFVIPSEHARFNDTSTSLGRRSWTYTWGTGDIGSVFYKNQLESIENPNGDLIVQNEYSAWDKPDETNPHINRVLEQTYGTDQYNYTVTDNLGNRVTNPGTDLQDSYYVWVSNRRNKVTRFEYSALPTGAAQFSSIPTQQLIEKVEYFVEPPTQAIDTPLWGRFDNNGNLNGWNYIHNDNGNPGTFTRAGDPPPIVTTFAPDENWRVTRRTLPNEDIVNFDYGELDFDPRSRGNVLSKTITDPVSGHAIRESWEYITYLGISRYGSRGFESAHIDGERNVTIKEYDGGPGSSDPKVGNLTKILYDFAPGTSTTSYIESNAMAVEKFEYNAYGQVTKHWHPHKMMWDDASETEVSHQRVDEYVYYTDPLDVGNYGRLRYQKIDTVGASAKNLITQFFYDKIGNVIKQIQPDDDVTVLLYNQMHELIREQRYNNTETELYAQTDYFYDANGNVVRDEVLNLDPDLNSYSNSSITRVLEYDILNFPTILSREHGLFDGAIVEDASGRAEALLDTSWVVQELAYDENRNLIQLSGGEAVRGNQADNIFRYEYDFRNLLASETHGDGADELIIEYKYDENGRQIERIVNPDGGTNTQHWSQEHDAFDRVLWSLDPMGNETRYEYDDNHNATLVSVCGPSDSDTSGGSDAHTTLYQTGRVHDRRDRVTSEWVAVFDSTSSVECDSLPAGVDFQSTDYEYNEDSSLYKMHEDSADSAVPLTTTTGYYDTVGRLGFVFDGFGNMDAYAYDAGSNLIGTQREDFSTSSAASQIFQVAYEYDALDRRTSIQDGVANTTELFYDSRSNMVMEVDARKNVKSYDYDLLGRLIATRVKMTADGDGPETDMVLDSQNPEIKTVIEYDSSNRVVAEIDDNLNRTEYEYDGLNRRTMIIMPDSAEYSSQYNANGQMSLSIDARGVHVSNAYDKNNRLIQRVVYALGATPLPVGAWGEKYTYDGLGRVLTATNYHDNILFDQPWTQVTRSYDSRGFVISETQNIDGANSFPTSMDRTVNYEYDLANNPTRIQYSSLNGRDIRRSYDSINRLVGIADHEPATPMPITDFEYIGRRLESRINGNTTETTYQYSGYNGAAPITGDFGFGRVVGITSTKGAATFDDFAFTWDKGQNRTSYNDLGSGMKNRRERSFGYDSSDRLVSTDVDFPEPNTDYPSPTNNGVTDYDLDGVHNRYSVTGFEEAGAPIGIYKDTTVDVPNHVKNNQYTYTPHANGGTWINSYDENGNLIYREEYNISDLNGDYEVDFLDINTFMAGHANQDPIADINGDGEWDFLDITAFLTAFTSGDGGALDRQEFTYDFRNQLVGIILKSGSNLTPVAVVTNTYDPMARRVVESSDLAGEGVFEKQMVYGCASLWEVIEQIQLGNDEKLLWSHVYGLGIDDEVSYRVENIVTPEDFWAHRDDLNSLTSVTDASGDVKERYQYGDYGQVTILDPVTGIERISSEFIGATHLYTGRSLITGTGLYDYRFRIMDPETGRFRQRDPLGYIDSMSMYAYVNLSPNNRRDPLGLGPYDDPYNVGGLNDAVDAWDSAGRSGRISKYIDGELGRYVYTRSAGWVDLRHVALTAQIHNFSDLGGGLAGDLFGGWVAHCIGFSVECAQVGSESFFAEEDLRSNGLGILYSIAVQSANGKITDPAMMRAFLLVLGVVEPCDPSHPFNTVGPPPPPSKRYIY